VPEECARLLPSRILRTKKPKQFQTAATLALLWRFWAGTDQWLIALASDKCLEANTLW